jgi:hypothetical protein
MTFIRRVHALGRIDVTVSCPTIKMITTIFVELVIFHVSPYVSHVGVGS